MQTGQWVTMTTTPGRATRSDALYEQVARNLRNKIQAGVLRDGEVLASTRELAAELGVSVFTISSAMKTLAAEGLVVTKSRSRRIVHNPDAEQRGRVRTEQPHVILVGGYAGCGKSELGRIVARLTGWPILDKDTITRPVVEVSLEALGRSPHDRESEDYLRLIRPREYEALISTAAENVECGVSVIVTAPFIKEFADPAWIERLLAAFNASDVAVTFVWLRSDAGTMHTYIRQRGAARDAAKLADWPAWLAGLDLDFTPPVQHVVLDNSASSPPLQAQAQDLVRQVLKQAT